MHRPTRLSENFCNSATTESMIFNSKWTPETACLLDSTRTRWRNSSTPPDTAGFGKENSRQEIERKEKEEEKGREGRRKKDKENERGSGKWRRSIPAFLFPISSSVFYWHCRHCTVIHLDWVEFFELSANNTKYDWWLGGVGLGPWHMDDSRQARCSVF